MLAAYLKYMNDLDLDLDSARIQLDTLGHHPTPSVCQELPSLLPPRWTPSFIGLCWLRPSSSLLVDLVLLYPGTCHRLPVQCLLWYALVVHTEDMSKPVKSSFSQYVVYGLLSSSGFDLHISYPVFSWDDQYTPLPSAMCSIQTFVNVTVNGHTSAPYRRVDTMIVKGPPPLHWLDMG